MVERGRKIHEVKKTWGDPPPPPPTPVSGTGVQFNSLPTDRRALLSERLEQAIKIYVSSFKTEKGFSPIGEFAPYPVHLPHLTSVPLLSQYVDPASEEHDENTRDS